MLGLDSHKVINGRFMKIASKPTKEQTLTLLKRITTVLSKEVIYASENVDWNRFKGTRFYPK